MILRLLTIAFAMVATLHSWSQGKITMVSLKENAFACSGPIIKYQFKCTSPAEKTENLLIRMINFSGFQGNEIHLYASDEVPNAITGHDIDNTVCIIINEQALAANESLVVSVLAHELGHVFARHLFINVADKKSLEFRADYYCGFWCARAKIPEATAVFLTQHVSESETHPNPTRRRDTIRQGYADASKPFTTDGSLRDAKSKYENVLDLYLLRSGNKVIKKRIDKWWVSIQLTSKDEKISLKDIIERIDRVVYVFDEDTFKRPLVKPTDDENSYKYRILVWGEFPVTAIVYFKDGSLLSISKSFSLPNNQTK